MKTFIISLDLEDFCSDYGRSLGYTSKKNTFASIKVAIYRLESLLKRFGQDLAFTIFVTGDFIKRHPEFVSELGRRHEISSHLFYHENVSILDRDTFENQIIDSVKIIKQVTGFNPPGYRSPNFKIINKNYNSFEILSKYFMYDSSQIYYLSYKNIISDHINEVPIPSIKIFGYSYKILGGTFLKLCPIYLIDFLFNKAYKHNILPQVYIHPYELIFGFDFLFNTFQIKNLSLSKKLFLLLRQLQWVGPINMIFYFKLIYILKKYKHVGRIDKSLLK